MNSLKTVIKSSIIMLMTSFSAGVLAAQTTKSGPSPVNSSEIIHVLLVMLLVIGAFIVTAYLMKKMGTFSFQKNDAIKVLSGVSIGPKENIILIQAGEKQLLVGVSQGGINTLHVLDEAIDMSETVKPTSFLYHLRCKMNEGKGS